MSNDEQIYRCFGESSQREWLRGDRSEYVCHEQGEVDNEQLGQVKDWLVKAMQYEGTGLIDRINFVTMLGDTYKALKQLDKAKEAYNQGYMEALQIENKMRSAQIQMIMKRKLEALELAK